MPTPARFQRWLVNELKRQELTQLALSEQMGVSHVTVGRWLRGARPRDSQLVRLSQVLGVDLLEIYAQLGAISIKPEELPVDVREIVRKLLLLSPAQRNAFDAMLAAMQGQLSNEPLASKNQVEREDA